jgi:CelD/BcsL family acetyltransferase involved in cellulose biosynthesis
MGLVAQQQHRAAPFRGGIGVGLLFPREADKDRLEAYDGAGAASARRGDGLYMQALGVEELEGNLRAWRELAARALEPNVFFEPAFALSLARHGPLKAKPRFIGVWRGENFSRRLVGLFPMAPSRPWLGRGLAALWLDKQMALATPLLDRDCAVEVLEHFFGWLGETQCAKGVLFQRLVKDGPVHRAILAAAHEARTLEAFERAALLKGSDRDELCVRGASRKTLKDLHRRRRRLTEEGEVEFSLVSAPRETRAAAERFLALEASGWKRRSGFLSHPSLAAFFRSATRLLAREGKCHIASLMLNGRALAMGVVLESQDRAFFWKIAYDEAHRASAPGIHLVYELSAALATRENIAMTDSCAIANHPMIDRFWPDRMKICDVAAPARGAIRAQFERSCDEELLRRRLREQAKHWAIRLFGRKES